MAHPDAPPVPDIRIHATNTAGERQGAAYVLYWMVAARRTRFNFALQRAVELADHHRLPLVVFEPLRCGYRWANHRIHRFVLDGMADNQAALAARSVAYYPYVEPEEGKGRQLLEALAANAAVVVTDTYPCFFVPRMVRAAAAALDVRLEEVDSNGVIPLRAVPKAYSRAFDFRRFLHKELTRHIDDRPLAEPLAARAPSPTLEQLVSAELLDQWPPASAALLAGATAELSALPIDADVPPSRIRGGAVAGGRALDVFLEQGLSRYSERNHPDRSVASGLSPYLHFGHVSAHEVVGTVLDDAEWTAPHPPLKATGSRSGWWGLSEDIEGFLDEIITWRELGYSYCWHRPDHDTYESLPGWALKSMDEHREDPRPELYSLEQLENAQTSDPIWNAAQRQLRAEGVIHNYLRMLWGKRIYEWSPTPEEAWRRLEHLNNRWSLDGRDPNSYSGIGWVMGRFDRAWGPERPIFGKLRYMTSGSTQRKLKLKQYLARWGEQPRLF
ncbi:MAG: deoxyribodipyrimidine photolyase [Deltaproteobacteria bacterium]|nr:deoxyribodipyrimidine photolyase [Deltaproteobacteria bacterium]